MIRLGEKDKERQERQERIRKVVGNIFEIKPITSPEIDAARKKAFKAGDIAEKAADLKDENGNPIPEEERYSCISGCGYVKGKPDIKYRVTKYCFGIGIRIQYCRICKQQLIPVGLVSRV